MLFTLFQLFKIGKLHPVFLLMKSQGVIGLNLLSIADQKPEKLKYVLQELVKLAKQNTLHQLQILNLTGKIYQKHMMDLKKENLQVKSTLN